MHTTPAARAKRARRALISGGRQRCAVRTCSHLVDKVRAEILCNLFLRVELVEAPASHLNGICAGGHSDSGRGAFSRCQTALRSPGLGVRSNRTRVPCSISSGMSHILTTSRTAMVTLRDPAGRVRATACAAARLKNRCKPSCDDGGCPVPGLRRSTRTKPLGSAGFGTSRTFARYPRCGPARAGLPALHCRPRNHSAFIGVPKVVVVESSTAQREGPGGRLQPWGRSSAPRRCSWCR